MTIEGVRDNIRIWGKNGANSKSSQSDPGPKPDLLKIEGDWQAAMKRSIKKKLA